VATLSHPYSFLHLMILYIPSLSQIVKDTSDIHVLLLLLLLQVKFQEI